VRSGWEQSPARFLRRPALRAAVASTSLARPNGINTSYSYDAQSRLQSVLHQLNGSTVDGASYTYDDAGNRTSKTDLLAGVTSNYGYDGIYQLTGVTQNGVTTESYSYDLVGNRLSSLGVSPYAYNSSNELTSTPAATYTYDSNGNTKTKVDATGTTTYNWDYENRLKSVVLPGGGGTVSFKYDPFGRRVQQAGPSGTTNYLYDGANVLEEVDQAGTLLARYTSTQNVDESLTETRSGTTSHYEQDGLGSVTSLSNASGALANTYTYDGFGKLTASTGTLVNPFQYTGREFDAGAGNYFYRARYYDQNVGRFVSEDPAGFGAGLDFYAYIGNRPVQYNDPFGLFARCVSASSSYWIGPLAILHHQPWFRPPSFFNLIWYDAECECNKTPTNPTIAPGPAFEVPGGPSLYGLMSPSIAFVVPVTKSHTRYAVTVQTRYSSIVGPGGQAGAGQNLLLCYDCQ